MKIDCIGNALTTNCEVLCHQVNLAGIMGGGIAYQIAGQFPSVEKEYQSFPKKCLGEVCFARANEHLVIANCFSQNEDFETDYNALKQCLDKVVDYMNKNGFNSVAIPYKYGCGIAYGNWNIVESIFEEKFKDKTLKIYHLK